MGRTSRHWVWLLPALLAAGQLLDWPIRPLLTGSRPAAAAIAAVLAITAAAAVALLWRRSNPVAATVVASAALSAGAWGLPADALTVIALADAIALFSVAARRPPRVALPVTGGLMVAQTLVVTFDNRHDLPTGVEIALTVTVYLIVLAAGRRHARWRAERAAAAERFMRAEERRARATEIERQRLTQELHDITAHHLTSIVVGATAAERMAGERAELVAQTLDHAARTGRATVEALRRLVAIMQTPPPPSLPVLVASFQDAGQPVTLTAPDVALPEAVPAIAREALTNTLRYAPGAPTRVVVARTPTGLELTVENDAPAGKPRELSIGSGNGIPGMRERARATGGDLTAGPRPGGGWQVRATLDAPLEPVAAARPARPWSAHVIDAVLIGLALVPPVWALWTYVTGSNPAVPGGPALMAAIVAIHALPLALRRTRPWPVLAAVAVTGMLWAAAIGTDLLPAASGYIPVTAIGADLLAVHAVGRYGHRARLDWLAVPAGVLPAGLSFGLAFAATPADGPDRPPWIALLLIFTLMFALIMAVPLGLGWLAGWFVRRRRAQVTTNEEEWIAWSAHHASMAATAERARIADGLSEAVLRHTERMIEAAERGALGEVMTEARAALAAMRGLLRDLRRVERQESPAARPTLAELAGKWRSHGRTVTLRVTGDDAERGYRLVELLLAADTGPAEVEIDATGEPLRITIRPAPDDPDGEIAAGLRARDGRVEASSGAWTVLSP
ncbi:histidine kinase [Actinoplanes sp. NPDC049265]|uniref:sensor histidine kinase n=1 Tax=Actinoplanes sp. NPDC049265 TaxID=3363902 RepID=UPI003722EA81